MSIDEIFDDEMMNDMIMNPDLYGLDDDLDVKPKDVDDEDYEEDEED